MSVAASFHLAAFHHLFRVVHANTPALRDVCYRLRHKVYCEEFRFEPTRNNGLERDEWDDDSIHCLVQNAINGEYVACARLIVPSSSCRGLTLPFERVCQRDFVGTVLDSGAAAASIAEVSRLAIIADYRRTTFVREQLNHSSTENDSNSQPPVLAGLLLGLLALGRQNGIQTAYMLVERRLARYLAAMMGFRPKIVAGPVEHNGARLLAMLSVQETVSGLNKRIRNVFEEMAVSFRDELTLVDVPQVSGRAVTTLSRPVRFA